MWLRLILSQNTLILLKKLRTCILLFHIHYLLNVWYLYCIKFSFSVTLFHQGSAKRPKPVEQGCPIILLLCAHTSHYSSLNSHQICNLLFSILCLGSSLAIMLCLYCISLFWHCFKEWQMQQTLVILYMYTKLKLRNYVYILWSTINFLTVINFQG